ncbi:MAG: hypothetical protein A3F16_05755 [Deltaproteobacteria bacterium RIFCSPHIGHO2_12_FULL_43_9]|nr:MAG: hypothetical protein A3F16_05755 [Deltaproteobacteria bacterium RIFCSPHIGHO2_12_FULL_43_9]
MRLEGDGILLRIYINETDKFEGKPLSQVIVDFLRKNGIAGATVIHGSTGFGAHSTIHDVKALRVSEDLPVIIETIDTSDKLDKIFPELENMIKEGLIIAQKVHVRKYVARGG